MSSCLQWLNDKVLIQRRGSGNWWFRYEKWCTILLFKLSDLSAAEISAVNPLENDLTMPNLRAMARL
jgi:hypothetical protein